MSSLKRFLPVLAGAVAGGAIALAVSSGGTTHSSTTTVVQPARNTSLPASFTAAKGLSVNQIYKQDAPGVVDIFVQSNGGSSGLLGASAGEGAGVVYDKRGNIVTDQHVVANATSIRVTFEDGRTAPATVVGTDSSTDSAVIHVNVPASELHPIPFANSDNAQVGDAVAAIGSPFSHPWTVTSGIVSATGRSIEAPNHFTIPAAIQTDAAINPGNSGGPLLDAAGDVLGLNDQIDTNNQTTSGEGSSSGVGFAIPANTVKRVADGFIAGHPVKHAYVGVSLDGTSGGGARISSQSAANSEPVVPGSPAAAAGLKPGDTVKLTYVRGGATRQASVTLTARPTSAPQIP